MYFLGGSWFNFTVCSSFQVANMQISILICFCIFYLYFFICIVNICVIYSCFNFIVCSLQVGECKSQKPFVSLWYQISQICIHWPTSLPNVSFNDIEVSSVPTDLLPYNFDIVLMSFNDRSLLHISHMIACTLFTIILHIWQTLQLAFSCSLCVPFSRSLPVENYLCLEPSCPVFSFPQQLPRTNSRRCCCRTYLLFLQISPQGSLI